jgi:hypothetical protein
MKTFSRLLAFTAVCGTAAVFDTAAAVPLFNGGVSAPQGCMVANTCRALNVDVPVYLWLIADNQTQGTGEHEGQREIKDASLGLDQKTIA